MLSDWRKLASAELIFRIGASESVKWVPNCRDNGLYKNGRTSEPMTEALSTKSLTRRRQKGNFGKFLSDPTLNQTHLLQTVLYRIKK